MAKVIKLKDRQGSVVLPLTRSQLVQVSEITGLDLLNGKTFDSASVQDALEALMTYATKIKQSSDTATTDITTIKSALEGVLDTQRAVANYVDNKFQSSIDLSYAKAKAEANNAETAAKKYADDKFLQKVKLNNAFVDVKSDDTNGRYVDLGSIATSDSLQTLTEKVNAIETAYITKDDSKAADDAIITAYQQADTALGTRIDNVIESYKGADAALGTRIDGVVSSYEAADAALTKEIDALKASYTVSVTEADGSGDIAKVYTITQADKTVGTINIPKDMVATQGELVHGSLVGKTFTPAEGGDPYIKMTVGNGNTSDTFYIPVAELIEYNSVKSNNEITLTDTGHKIEATVGNISSGKITFTPAGDKPTDTTVQAALRDLYSQIGEGGSVASQIQAEIQKLDADLDASGTAQHNGTFVVSGVTEVDGVITAVDSVEVEAAGAAATVKTELLGNADESNNTLGKLANRIDTLDGAAVKKVNGQTPGNDGAVTVNANQIDTTTTFKIGSDTSATTHKVDEILAAGVFYEQVGTKELDDVNLTF